MPIHSVLIQKLLSTNAHLGRRTATHNLKPYIYGSRNATSIIDIDKTLISLRAALSFLTQLHSLSSPSKPPRILFVNTNPLYDDVFDHVTRTLNQGSFFTSQYWKQCGFLTNSASPKKFRSRNKKLTFGPVYPPDCVVVLDKERKSSVINEAARMGVPIVGFVDTECPREVFDKITYPIPCNDSAQFVYLVCNLITKTILLERKNAGVVGVGVGKGVDEEVEKVVEKMVAVEEESAESKIIENKEESVEGMEGLKIVPHLGVEPEIEENKEESVEGMEGLKIVPHLA